MTERSRLSRRQLLALSGTACSAAVAGCTSSGGDGSDDDDWQQPLDPDDWEDVDEIRLLGYTGGWEGVEPDLIAGIRNPSLLLFAGSEYEITWENGDGIGHNIAIRNEDQQVVGNNRTSNVRTRGETQTHQFSATEEMHEYVCEPHPRGMLGYIHVKA